MALKGRRSTAGQVNTVYMIGPSRVLPAEQLVRTDPACRVCSSLLCLCCVFVVNSAVLMLHFSVCIYTIDI